MYASPRVFGIQNNHDREVWRWAVLKKSVCLGTVSRRKARIMQLEKKILLRGKGVCPGWNSRNKEEGGKIEDLSEMRKKVGMLFISISPLTKSTPEWNRPHSTDRTGRFLTIYKILGNRKSKFHKKLMKKKTENSIKIPEGHVVTTRTQTQWNEYSYTIFSPKTFKYLEIRQKYVDKCT